MLFCTNKSYFFMLHIKMKALDEISTQTIITCSIRESRQCPCLPFILLFSSQLGEGYSACFPTQTLGPICSQKGTTFVKVDWIMALASLL